MMSSFLLLVLVVFSYGPLFLSAGGLESLAKRKVTENVDLYFFDAEKFCNHYPPLFPVLNSSENADHAYMCSWGNSDVGFTFLSTNPNQLSCLSSGCFGKIAFDPSRVEGFSFTIHVPKGKEVTMYPGKAWVELLWLGSRHCTGITSFNVSIPTRLGSNIRVGKMWSELGQRGTVGNVSFSSFLILTCWPQRFYPIPSLSLLICNMARNFMEIVPEFPISLLVPCILGSDSMDLLARVLEFS
eukprot:TRINITY_DN6174_c1_g1_i1.p1 TRINITY_DN6174_c1_g1~~TRINITY_DN6174_c1_g1_i1.p1  ORF type:complete len:242 (-),score=20.87 TRINITY_DN6174_c1_g1_i1:106-831(-)